MLYLVAILCPPLALLFNGQFGSMIVNLVMAVAIVLLGAFTFGVGLFGLIIPIAHAWVCISRKEADRRDERLVKAMAAGNAAGQRK